MKNSPIGVFDSGFGGLTILKEIVKLLPEYDYLYLGDNARAPYGPRSFETVYQYTLEAVEWFFKNNCELVILACNTASAKALRTIQQKDLSRFEKHKRVLGVIRPSTEIIGTFTTTGKIGIMGTRGTVLSNSYPIEISKFFPTAAVYQQACPMWVPLIENAEYNSAGADYFVKKYIDELFEQESAIDTVLLACTHYPLLIEKIQKNLPSSVKLVTQGGIVANSLVQYLENHSDLANMISKNDQIQFFTTDDTLEFNQQGTKFFGQELHSTHIFL